MQSTINSLLDPIVNFGKVTVSVGYDNFDTVIVLADGNGAKLPNPGTDGHFNLVWFNNSTYSDPTDDPNVEIVRCIARTGDVLTITRGEEGTIASNKNVSGKIYKMILSPTKKTIDDIQTESLSNISAHAGLTTGVHGVTGYILGSEDIGVATGIAGLDANGKVPTTQLPALALTNVYTVANQTDQLTLLATTQEGDVAIRTDENKSYVRNAGVSGTMTDWSLLLTPTDVVTSVFGRTGVVAASNNDYTWGQIDKTTSSIGDITTKSHTLLTDIGTNNHAAIDTHIGATGTSVHGLGSMSTQAAGSVAITGGSITGITDLAVADGGTGASTLTGVLIGNATSPITGVSILTSVNGGTGNGFTKFTGATTSEKTYTLPNADATIEYMANKNIANGYVGTDASNYIILARFQPITTVSSTYAITANDYTIVCSAAITVTLPTAIGIPGRIYNIKNTSSGTVTIATTSSQTIDGSTTRSMTTQYETITVQSNNANWMVI